MSLFTPRHDRPCARGGPDRRGRRRLHGPAPAGGALGRALPVPRGADSLVLGQAGRGLLLLLRLRGRRRHDPLRPGEGRARHSRTRSRRSPTASGSTSSARPRTRRRRSAVADAGGSAKRWNVHRPSTRRISGRRRRRRRLASTWPGVVSARRSCARSASASLRAPGIRCCCADNGPASRSRS